MKVVRKEILPYVWLTCLRTDKFKTGCLSVSLLQQLSKANAPANALIPRTLRRGTSKYPDMESLAAAMDGLYGLRIEPAVRKKGELQVLGFYADFPDDSFVPGRERILEKATGLIGELLLQPNTRGGLLLPQYVDSEKEKLLEQIRSRVNDKRQYSIQRLFELMCFAEDYAVDRLGGEEEAEAINYTKLTRQYRDLLYSSPVEIFYCGNADFTRVESTLSAAFETLPRGEIDYEMGTDIRMNTVDESVRYYSESMDVTQGKLAIGYRLGECMTSPDYAALRVTNAVFGGGVNSKLFMNVREKLSLAYFANSILDWHKGIMAVSSGIEFDKYDEALSEITLQLEEMVKGNITDEELTAAKQYVATSLRTAGDSPGALEDFYLSQNIEGLRWSPDELAEAVGLVSREDVVNTAGNIVCDAVYFLKGADGEEESL